MEPAWSVEHSETAVQGVFFGGKQESPAATSMKITKLPIDTAASSVEVQKYL